METIDVFDKVRVIRVPKKSAAVLNQVYTVLGIHCLVRPDDTPLIGVKLEGVPKMIDARCCRVEEKANVTQTNVRR